MAGFGVLGTVALGQGLSRWLSRPVQRLTQTCEALAADPDSLNGALLADQTAPV